MSFDSLIGLALGIISGISLAVVAFLQQYPKWKAQGFARAKTQAEKQIIKNYYSSKSYKNKMNLYYKKYAVPLIALFILLSGIVIATNTLLFASFSFVVSFVIVFIALGFIADPIIRNKK